MSGVVDLGQLIQQMSPVLDPEAYVFCCVPGGAAEYADLEPVGTFIEAEGLTLILTAAAATRAQLPFEGTYQRITLTVHSSLEAVGLTAVVATALADAGISANVVAAYYHDHVFVQSQLAEQAISTLHALIEQHTDT